MPFEPVVITCLGNGCGLLALNSRLVVIEEAGDLETGRGLQPQSPGQELCVAGPLDLDEAGQVAKVRVSECAVSLFLVAVQQRCNEKQLGGGAEWMDLTVVEKVCVDWCVVAW